MDKKLFRIDGILWEARYHNIIPFCPIHRLELESSFRDLGHGSSDNAMALICEDCKEQYKIPRQFWREREYVKKKIESKDLKDIKILNFDDEAIPLAEEKVSSEDNKFFVNSLLVKTKVGNRLIVYAGEKGRKEKTQIFVEPDIKRIGFDQKDIHPTDIFLKLEGTFRDGTKFSMNKE